MVNWSHPIKAETVVILYFWNPHVEYQSQVHAAGCAHARRADLVGEPMDAAAFVAETESEFVDDWFYVAPCARKGGA